MNITESGFLDISDIKENKIVISKDTQVVIFDKGSEIETITLDANLKFGHKKQTFFTVIKWQKNCEIFFPLDGFLKIYPSNKQLVGILLLR